MKYTDENELLKVAKEKFPIGTKYKTVSTNGGIIQDSINILTNEPYLHFRSGEKYWVIGNTNLYNPITDEWAEIIELPKVIYEIY